MAYEARGRPAVVVVLDVLSDIAVIKVDRDDLTADQVRETALQCGGLPVVADVGTETGIARVVDAVTTLQAEGPDIVVHAAGAFALAPLAETSVEAFDRMIAVNLRGAFLLMHHLTWLGVLLVPGETLAIRPEKIVLDPKRDEANVITATVKRPIRA